MTVAPKPALQNLLNLLRSSDRPKLTYGTQRTSRLTSTSVYEMTLPISAQRVMFSKRAIMLGHLECIPCAPGHTEANDSS
jgi:hypothetical protein